jgi:hypothetical protein
VDLSDETVQHDPNQQVSGLDLSSESSRNRVLNEQNQVQTTPSSSTGANSELLIKNTLPVCFNVKNFHITVF